MSFVAQIRAENYGRLLAEGLTRFADRYGIPTKDNHVTYLLSRGARDPALARSLAKAMRHFLAPRHRILHPLGHAES
jgi:hypothetical protein